MCERQEPVIQKYDDAISTINKELESIKGRDAVNTTENIMNEEPFCKSKETLDTFSKYKKDLNDVLTQEINGSFGYLVVNGNYDETNKFSDIDINKATAKFDRFKKLLTKMRYHKDYSIRQYLYDFIITIMNSLKGNMSRRGTLVVFSLGFLLLGILFATHLHFIYSVLAVVLVARVVYFSVGLKRVSTEFSLINKKKEDLKTSLYNEVAKEMTKRHEKIVKDLNRCNDTTKKVDDWRDRTLDEEEKEANKDFKFDNTDLLNHKLKEMEENKKRQGKSGSAIADLETKLSDVTKEIDELGLAIEESKKDIYINETVQNESKDACIYKGVNIAIGKYYDEVLGGDSFYHLNLDDRNTLVVLDKDVEDSLSTLMVIVANRIITSGMKFNNRITFYDIADGSLGVKDLDISYSREVSMGTSRFENADKNRYHKALLSHEEYLKTSTKWSDTMTILQRQVGRHKTSNKYNEYTLKSDSQPLQNNFLLCRFYPELLYSESDGESVYTKHIRNLYGKGPDLGFRFIMFATKDDLAKALLEIEEGNTVVNPMFLNMLKTSRINTYSTAINLITNNSCENITPKKLEKIILDK